MIPEIEFWDNHTCFYFKAAVKCLFCIKYYINTLDLTFWFMFSPDVKRKNPKDIKGGTRAKTRDKSMTETQELAISHKKVFTFVRKWKKNI